MGGFLPGFPVGSLPGADVADRDQRFGRLCPGPDCPLDVGGPPFVIRIPVIGRLPEPPLPPGPTVTYNPPVPRTREVQVPLSRNKFGGLSRMATFLPGGSSRYGMLGGIIGGVLGALGRHTPLTVGMPSDTTISVPNLPGIPNVTFPIPDFTIGVKAANCRDLRRTGYGQCATTSGKRTRKGRIFVDNMGRMICCPNKPRMNPLNARALTRAARRLKGFVRVEKRIHKALRRACGPMGRSMGRGRRSRSVKCCK